MIWVGVLYFGNIVGFWRCKLFLNILYLLQVVSSTSELILQHLHHLILISLFLGSVELYFELYLSSLSLYFPLGLVYDFADVDVTVVIVVRNEINKLLFNGIHPV